MQEIFEFTQHETIGQQQHRESGGHGVHCRSFRGIMSVMNEESHLSYYLVFSLFLPFSPLKFFVVGGGFVSLNGDSAYWWCCKNCRTLWGRFVIFGIQVKLTWLHLFASMNKCKEKNRGLSLRKKNLWACQQLIEAESRGNFMFQLLNQCRLNSLKCSEIKNIYSSTVPQRKTH